AFRTRPLTIDIRTTNRLFIRIEITRRGVAMATTYEASNVPDARSAPTARTPVARQSRPVVVWASIGAIFVAMEIYSFASWILSGRATPTPTGVTPVSTGDYVFGL